jgi:two-component system, response regulator YesN
MNLFITLFEVPEMKPLYKVFLVEDEVVIREGIRERIDWIANGFEFCGEAPDGEIALPLIKSLKPDILITDIKMPFMNGLELARIVHETMPEVRTVILSGHDEFEYAREAIKQGVVEYLLKPISPADLLDVLLKISRQFEKEAAEMERLKGIQESQYLPFQRDKLLMQLVLGGVSSMEALEKSIQLKINLIARCYQIILIRAEFYKEQPDQFDYDQYEKAEQIITDVVNRESDVISFKKGLGETVVILKNDSINHLDQDCYLLTEAVKEEVRQKTRSQISIGVSSPCERLGDLPRAFFEALMAAQPFTSGMPGLPEPESLRPEELLALDTAATDKYLSYGIKKDFDNYFESYTSPVVKGSTSKRLFLEYIFLDILITTANFINDLGGDANIILPELEHCEQLATSLNSIDQVQEQTRQILIRALDFRDKRSGSQTATLMGKARDYIEDHYQNPDISLNSIASFVNLSPSHFSVVFSRETGETFIGYLTRKRIEKAKELLRSTSLRTSEISERIGYENPHYFSTVFKKITSFSPTDFRNQAHPEV